MPIEGPHQDDIFWISQLKEDGQPLRHQSASRSTPDRWLVDGDQADGRLPYLLMSAIARACGPGQWRTSEGQLPTVRLLAVHQPAVGRGTVLRRLCRSGCRPPSTGLIQKMSSPCGPSIGTPSSSARIPADPQWSIWPWVSRIFSIFTPAWAVPLSASACRPPDRRTRPASSLCTTARCNSAAAVTGMIAARSGRLAHWASKFCCQNIRLVQNVILVGLLGEAVALVLAEQVPGGAAVAADRADDLVGFRGGHARIVAAGHTIQRHARSR